MAWMSDEKYEYIEDVKDKAFTARSARNKKGHTGKGGAVRTASDFMTKKQLDALNGECKTYRLGAPMSWDEFSKMPDDLKAMYIKNLRKKFNVPDTEIADMMGVDISVLNEFSSTIKPGRLVTDNYSWYNTDDCGRFLTWLKNSEEEKTHGQF